MKISVVVPIYNGEVFLKTCINSLLNQSYRDFELILIDDGSRDQSGYLCDLFAEKDSRIKVIHKENEGLICARITGVNAASTEYIAFVDADDWVEEDYLEGLISPIKETKADIIISGCFYEKDGESHKTMNYIEAGLYEGKKLELDLIPRMLHYGGFYQFGILPYMWNKLFRRKILLDCYDAMDTRIYDGEDVATVFPYLLKVKKAMVIPECMYHYRIHKNSMTFQKRDDFYENVSRLYLHLYHSFKESPYFNQMLPQLAQYMRMMVWVGMPAEEAEAQRHFFPFKKIPWGSRVILYGAGQIGKVYHWQIERTQYCKLVCWVDQNYEELARQGLSVQAPEQIEQMDYDYVVIANGREKIQKEIERALLEKGVKKGQIITEDNHPIKILD